MATTTLTPITAPTLPEDMEYTITVVPVDDDGSPAELDSAPSWSGGSNGEVTPAADGLSCVVAGVAAAKSGDTVTVTIQAASEGDQIIQAINIPLGPGGVASFGASFSTPVKKGSPPPPATKTNA